MKKVLLAVATLMLSFGIASAQDMAQATETYNNGATALSMGDKAGALQYFQSALKMGETIGEEAKELVTNCKNAIPGIILSIGKEAFNGQKFDEALAKFQEAQKAATDYKVEDVLAECKELIPQVAIQKDLFDANNAYEAKNMKAAIDGFKKVLAADSTNSVASIRIIQSLAAVGMVDEAKEFMPLAELNGQGSNASKVLGISFLKSAAAALKAKQFDKAIANALDANDYIQNPQTYLIAGQASTKLNKTADAIKYFEKYLEGAPTAKNAGAIALTVGALYQGQKNNAKAIEFYKLAKEKGQDTQKYIDALSK